jgi:hypothetical protein
MGAAFASVELFVLLIKPISTCGDAIAVRIRWH